MRTVAGISRIRCLGMARTDQSIQESWKMDNNPATLALVERKVQSQLFRLLAEPMEKLSSRMPRHLRDVVWLDEAATTIPTAMHRHLLVPAHPRLAIRHGSRQTQRVLVRLPARRRSTLQPSVA